MTITVGFDEFVARRFYPNLESDELTLWTFSGECIVGRRYNLRIQGGYNLARLHEGYFTSFEVMEVYDNHLVDRFVNDPVDFYLSATYQLNERLDCIYLEFQVEKENRNPRVEVSNLCSTETFRFYGKWLYWEREMNHTRPAIAVHLGVPTSTPSRYSCLGWKRRLTIQEATNLYPDSLPLQRLVNRDYEGQVCSLNHETNQRRV